MRSTWSLQRSATACFQFTVPVHNGVLPVHGGEKRKGHLLADELVPRRVQAHLARGVVEAEAQPARHHFGHAVDRKGVAVVQRERAGDAHL